MVGRSRVVDYAALRHLLTNGHLGGAVLDVFDTEPLPADDPMWACPNLVITPHCSLDDHSVYLQQCLDLFIDNLQRFTGAASYAMSSTGRWATRAHAYSANSASTYPVMPVSTANRPPASGPAIHCPAGKSVHALVT